MPQNTTTSQDLAIVPLPKDDDQDGDNEDLSSDDDDSEDSDSEVNDEENGDLDDLKLKTNINGLKAKTKPNKNLIVELN